MMKIRYRLATKIVGFLLALIIALSGQAVFGFNVTGHDLSENDTKSTKVTYTIKDQQFSNTLYATQPYLSTTHAFDTGKFLDKNGKLKVKDIHAKFSYSDWKFEPAKRGLNGGFEIVGYYACVPDTDCLVRESGETPDGTITSSILSSYSKGGVGAYIYVDYVPGVGDPASILGAPINTNDLHWLQFVDASDDGRFVDIQPATNRGETPYYDTGQSAAGFYHNPFTHPTKLGRIYVRDTPYRGDESSSGGADKEHTWKAELYLVHQQTGTKTVTVYNGITWGWHNEKDAPCNTTENQSKSDNKQDKNQCPIAANIWGDPHMTTFDGLKYDLQTLGEFTLVKSHRSDFEVQSRHIPYNSSGSLAISSAVAMKVGGDRVAIYAQGLPDADTTTPLRVNGKPTNLQGDKLALPGGGEILRQGGNYVMSAPTGEKVLVSSNGSYLNISPVVDNRAGKYSGLLGNVNGNPKDDLQVRDGSNVLEVRSTYGDVNKVLNQVGLRLPGALDRAEKVYFDQLYKEFANSWRVKQKESLFDYPAGKTTKSYLDPSFPDQYLKLDMLSPEQIEKARNACTESKVSQELMEGCIFDVGFSGYSEFARTTSEINGYVNIVNQLFPGSNIPTTGQVVDQVIQKVKPKVCLPFVGCV
ncbi:VWD domain-containing protein [Nostoc sp.]|uniref:VWD domain-containing protein n=1 Tax=Nostoc sp. TaxID=1180 RepID=UPI002FFD43AA